MDKQYSGQDVLSAFQLPRKPVARQEGYAMADFESPYLQPLFETAALTVEQAARSWGNKAAISQYLEQLTHAAMPQLGGKKTAAMTSAEKAAFNKMWVSIRGQLIDKRRQLIAGGLVPPLGGAAVPFGFKMAKYGSHSGLAADTTYLKSPRLDTTLANLQQQGKINITQDQLDIFQRVANVETSGGVQTLNTYDSAVVSIGFFQFTLHVGKLQAWINLAPDAFRKFGIELDATLKYKFGQNGTHPAIKGVPDGRRNDLRWNGWAERFYYAGLHPDVIAAQVTLALKYLSKHLSDLKARMKDKAAYDAFYRFYTQHAYVRGLFQASHNNNPARSTRSVKAAIAKAGNGDVASFLEEYKNIMIASDWERLVKETAKGATATVQADENELMYEDYIAADIPEMLTSAEDEYETYEAEDEYSEFEDEPDFGDEPEFEAEPDLHDHETIEFEDEPDFSDEFEEGEAEFEDGPDFGSEFEEGENDADIYEENGELETEPGEEEFPYLSEDESAQTAGITRYLAVSALPGGKYKTGAYLPPSFTPSANVDVVLYFHGLYPANDIEKYWAEYTPLRELFASGNKNALLLAPQLGANPQNLKLVFFQSGGLDKFLNDCFAELIAAGQLPPGAKPARIIAAAHSAGGHPLSGVLRISGQSLKKITECWGFDSIYGDSYDTTSYNYNTWLRANPHLRFYHYWATSKPRKLGDEYKKAYPNFSNIASKKSGDHQGMIADVWENEVNKRTWFTTGTAKPAPAASSTGMTVNMIAGIPFLPESSALDIAYSNGIRDKNQLTNLVFYKRNPAYRGRSLTASDPQKLKSDWTNILKTVVTPYLQRQANAPAAPSPKPAPSAPSVPSAPSIPSTPSTPVVTNNQFVLQTLSLQQTGAEITIKDNKGRSAKITEKPAVFLKECVRKAGLNVDNFFNSMTRIKFLGREFNGGQLVHVELAKVLRKVEAGFVSKAGGNVKDMKALGDQLGLLDKYLPASRGASLTADLSWHMFGLALDVNATYSPYIRKPSALNSFMVKVGYLVTGGKIAEIPLARKSTNFVAPGNTTEFLSLYDQLVVYNKYFKEYFSYIDDPTTLSRKLATAGDSWKGKSLAEAQAIISKDLATLAASWLKDRPTPEQKLKDHGFIQFSREFVQGMVEAGINWGAWYGDIMHFDMRNTSIGEKITNGKILYQREKLDEMGITIPPPKPKPKAKA